MELQQYLNYLLDKEYQTGKHPCRNWDRLSFQLMNCRANQKNQQTKRHQINGTYFSVIPGGQQSQEKECATQKPGKIVFRSASRIANNYNTSTVANKQTVPRARIVSSNNMTK